MADRIEQITQERGSVYGPFLQNGIASQGLKNTMRSVCCWVDLPPDVQEGLDLIATKISRILTGDYRHLDNWDDIAGYAKIVGDRLRSQPKIGDIGQSDGGGQV